MRIFPVTFTCERDRLLNLLSVYSLQKRGVPIQHHMFFVDSVYDMTSRTDYVDKFTDYIDGFNCQAYVKVQNRDWPIWPDYRSCLAELDHFRSMMRNFFAQDIEDHYSLECDDYILYHDSDVLFFDPVKDILNSLGDADFYGIKSDTELGYFSGCFRIFRAKALLRILELGKADLDVYASQIREMGYPLINDVFTSYLMMQNKENVFHPFDYKEIQASNLEGILLRDEKPNGAIVHLSNIYKEFLGVPVTGKWDIPKVLMEKGIVIP